MKNMEVTFASFESGPQEALFLFLSLSEEPASHLEPAILAEAVCPTWMS
jgi:hypothetical protein